MSKDNLYFETVGTGPDLVLLHGWGMSSRVWMPLVNELKHRFRFTLIDLPGFGKSPLFPNAYKLEYLCQKIFQIAPVNASYLGWSLGGLIATAMALNHASHVTKLINIGSSPKFVKTADWPGMAISVLDNFAQSLTKDYKDTLTQFLLLQFMGCENPRLLLKNLRDNLRDHPEPQPDALRRALDLLATADLRSKLANIKCPNLYILGRLDALVPVSVGEQLASIAPQASIEIIKGASHAPFLSHPEEFITIMEKFIHEA